MAGRRSDCHVVGLQIYTYLPIYLVSYQPIIAEKSRRTFHDGTRMFRLVDTRMTHGIMVLKEDFKKCKEHLTKLGFEKIEARQLKASFPRYCPKCDKPNGYPHLRLVKKTLSDKDRNFRGIEKAKYQLYYSHSRLLYRQCFIGYWTTDNHIKLAKGISPRKMSPFYHLREGQSLVMPLPKKFMKKPEILR
jgi:hypothetical protein